MKARSRNHKKPSAGSGGSRKDSKCKLGEEQHVWPILRSLRRRLLQRRAAELPLILALQKLRSPVLDYYEILSSALCEEIGLITIMPGSTWAIDPWFCICIASLVGLNICLGNYIKNLLLIPRPDSPPAWRCFPESDYGTPSTHTLNGAAMSFLAVWYFFFLHPGHFTVISPGIALVMAVFWSLNIGVSRMYLGAHSPMDVYISLLLLFPVIFGGFIFGGGKRLIFSLVLSEGPYVLLVIPVTILAVYFHPRAPKPNSCVPESSMIVATAAGPVVGGWLSRHYRSLFGTPPQLVNIGAHVSYPWLIFSRVVAGAVVAVITRFVVKKGATAAVHRLWKFKYPRTSSLEKYQTVRVTEEDIHDMQVIVKYVTYFAISIACLTVTPWYIFPAFGLYWPAVDDLVRLPITQLAL